MATANTLHFGSRVSLRRMKSFRCRSSMRGKSVDRAYDAPAASVSRAEEGHFSNIVNVLFSNINVWSLYLALQSSYDGDFGGVRS